MNNRSKSNLSLNSSYPKDYIYPDSQNVPSSDLLKEEELWDKKEIIYVAGNLDNKTNKLLSLWLAYGNTFVADRAVYLNLIDEIRESIAETNATLQESKELARATGIDPLKHSNLRVRGMYELKHPAMVFENYVDKTSFKEECTEIFLVILKKDLETLENSELNPDFSKFYEEKRLIKKEIIIDNPNDASKKLEAVIYCGYTE